MSSSGKRRRNITAVVPRGRGSYRRCSSKTQFRKVCTTLDFECGLFGPRTLAFRGFMRATFSTRDTKLRRVNAQRYYATARETAYNENGIGVVVEFSGICRRPQGDMYTEERDKRVALCRATDALNKARRAKPATRAAVTSQPTHLPIRAVLMSAQLVAFPWTHQGFVVSLMSVLSRHGRYSSLRKITRQFSSGSAKDLFSDSGAADILVTVTKAGDLPHLQRLPEVS